jgi:hypothetical protein
LLIFASMPVLWGLASNTPPTDSAPGAQTTEAAVAPETLPSAAEQATASAVAQPPEDIEAPVASKTAAPAPAEEPPREDSKPPRDCVPTPLTPEGLAQALWEGHVRRFGAEPRPDRWACAWAHVAFEQARGEAVYSNNLGHVTARSSVGRVCRRRLRERVAKDPDRWEVMDVWFPIFDTPADGATAYWQLLSTSYSSVLARCDAADARGAARRLGEIGYFTGPEAPYIDGMARLFINARGLLIPRLIASAAAR